MAIPTTTGTHIEGPPTATVQQALGWVMRKSPAAGSCDYAGSGGRVVEYLRETERLSEKLGWDFAVVAAHASAATDGFTSPAWKTSMNTLPTVAGAESAGAGAQFGRPQEAAAAHIAYLATLTRGGEAEAATADAEPAVGMQSLRDAGYFNLVPAGAVESARAERGQAEALEDLGAGVLEVAALSEHLAGIREAVEPETENAGDTPAGAPPLPEIVWMGTDNWHHRLGGIRPVAICYHTTWDMNLDNVIQHFRNPASWASSTFVIDRDGTPYQMMSSEVAPWTNGDYRDVDTGAWNNPTTLIPWFTEAVQSCERGEHNLNDFFITYEFISTPDIPPTDRQYETAIQLSRYFCHPAVYGISPHRGHHMRHADVNSVSKWFDPGAQFDLRRIILAIGGDPTNMLG